MDFKEQPKINKEKIVDEIGKLAIEWWKKQKRNDPVLLEKFVECCNKIGSQSIQNAESSLLILRNWILKSGFIFERVHRFHIRIQIAADVVDIKINYQDFEYFVLVNEKVEKMFTNISEIQPWLSNRFNIATDHFEQTQTIVK
jgi:hypothetical protein